MLFPALGRVNSPYSGPLCALSTLEPLHYHAVLLISRSPPRSKVAGTEFVLSRWLKCTTLRQERRLCPFNALKGQTFKTCKAMINKQTSLRRPKLLSFPKTTVSRFQSVVTSSKTATGGSLSQVPMVFPSFAFCADFCSWQAEQEQMEYIAPFASSKVWIHRKLQSQCNYILLLFSHPSHTKLKMLMFLFLHGISLTLHQLLRLKIPRANRCPRDLSSAQIQRSQSAKPYPAT